MDLRGILNTSDNGEQQQQQPRPPPPPAAAAASTPKQPPMPHPHYQQQSRSPSTPSQGKLSYPYDYAPHPAHGSPIKPAAQEFPPPPPQAQRQQSVPYSVQSPYQQPATYPRPAPPPIQAQGYDVRTPGGGSGPMAAPSPYRTPSATGPTSAGYFPAQQPTELTSPIQQHPAQFPSQETYQQGRERYSSQAGPPTVGVTIPPGPGSGSGPYMQQSPLPQTPPVGTPGGAHHYIHQRSQSVHSNNTPTPTSANSQHPQYPPQPYSQQQPLQQQPQPQPQPQPQSQPQSQHHSPVVTHSPVATSHTPVFARQHSQPPTPAGPPASSAGPGPGPGPPTRHGSKPPPNFSQPSSPYSQRLSSVGPPFPQQQQIQPSPPQPPTAHLPNSRSSESQDRNSLSRNRTPSISPKTRISSLPLSGLSINQQPLPSRDREIRMAPTAMPDQVVTPAKRKMVDRDRDTDDEADRRDVRQRRQSAQSAHSASVNGIHGTPGGSSKQKPRRYAEVPVWAQSSQGRELKHGNYVLLKKQHHAVAVNGGRQDSVRLDKSRHASPEASRAHGHAPVQATPAPAPAHVPGPSPAPAHVAVPNAPAAPVPAPAPVNAPVPTPAVAVAAPPPPPPDPNAETTALLGPWEPTITNTKPFDAISRKVADFLFLNVVMSPDSAEIAARGIEFEIEAKLGTLIDRETGERVFYREVETECLLRESSRISFRSSMTELHHKWYNEFLNEVVVRTDPRHAENTGPVKRVPVQYKHRREVDKYFELPPALQGRLPGCVLSRLKHTPKARVTYDQRTGELLAKIVKVRVADLSIHMPELPFDCRISINLEMNWDGPVEELEQLPVTQDRMSGRNKDRLSYAQGNIQVDLTQVTTMLQAHGGQRPEREHELEVELSAAQVIEQGRRLMNQPEPLPSKYPELVESFVDNIRLLARKAAEREGQGR